MSSSTFYNGTNLVGVGSVAVGGFIPIAGGPTLGVIGNVYASTGFWGAGNNISNVQISTSFSGLNPGGVIYAQTVNAILSSAAGTSGQIFVSGGASAPTWTSYISPTLIYANTLSNISGSNVTTGINASNITTGILSSSYIYGNTLWNINASNIVGFSQVSGNTLSNINASNLAFGIVSSSLIYGNTLSNINSSNITQPFANLVVSNSVTTTNEFVTGTLNVAGSMTANITNTTFYFDTFTIPYINTLVMNSQAVTTGTLSASGLTVTGSLIASGEALSSLNASNITTGTLGNSLLPTIISVSNVTANGFGLYSINGSNVTTGISASNITTGTLSSTFITGLNAASQWTGTSGSTIYYTSNVGIGSTVAPTATLMVTGNIYASNSIQTNNIVATGFTSNSTNTNFNFDTLSVPFLSVTTLNVLSTSNISATYAKTLNVSSTSNISATYATTLNVSSTSNISATYATTLNVSSTSNLASVVSSGQVISTGKAGFVGVCPPIVFRQGAGAANWNIPGTTAATNVYAITSGAVQMQCGANIMPATTQSISFPLAYTNNPIVLVTSYGLTGNIWVAAITASSFTVQANVPVQFEWFSMGI